MHPLLEIKDLSVAFETEGTKVPALHNISFKVNSGETVAIVGESGSGKSVTSLSILRLLATPPARFTSGEILFSTDGSAPENLLALQENELRVVRGNRIAMIFQEPMTSLNPVFSCGDQVMEAIRLHQEIASSEAKQRTLALFEKVKLPDPPAIFHRYPHQLSGGQKQRVMIAMAMSCNPSLLIADEPTTALDVTVQKSILQLIRELQDQYNMGVIFISHDLGLVAEIADRIIVVYKGRLVEEGSVAQILGTPAHPYTKALLACRPALHPKGERLPVVSDFLTESTEGMLEKNQSRVEVNKAAGSIETKQTVLPGGSKLLEVKALNVWFPSKRNFLGAAVSYIKAVNNVSFDVYEGETLGLVGESGCGKTTLGRALLRLIEPVSGEIKFRGTNLLAYPPEHMRAIRKEMQIIFQDPYSSLNPRMTIGQAITEAMQTHRIGKTARERKQLVAGLLEKVNLRPEHADRYPHEFSGGQRQRIVIARALALHPSFIICDESVSSLDVSVQAQVLNLLNDLKREFRFTAIFISHDLSVVRYISDRIMVMNKGSIEELGDAEQVYHHPQSAYTKKLIESIPKIF
jgi:peptide/nickel transport system ATP-binding protein